MSAINALSEFGSNVLPCSTDLIIGVQMASDPVLRKLSGRVMKEMVSIGVATKNEIDETATPPTKLKWWNKALSKAYIPALVGYTIGDESATAPFARTIADKTKAHHLPKWEQFAINNGSVLAFSGTMAVGLGLMAMRWRDNRGLLPDKKAKDQYSFGSWADTTAVGAPIRAHFGEFSTKTAALLHGTAYVVVGQEIAYNVLATGGASNGFFYGALGTYIAYRYTSSLYNGTMPITSKTAAMEAAAGQAIFAMSGGGEPTEATVSFLPTLPNSEIMPSTTPHWPTAEAI